MALQKEAITAYRHVGVTGTRWGTTDEQKEEINNFFTMYKAQGEVLYLHHGDCIGGDEDTHAIFDKFWPNHTYIHPARDVSQNLRSHCEEKYSTLEVLRAKDTRDRNRDIVTNSFHLLVLSKHNQEQPRYSGTWATYRMAVRQRKLITIIWPDGIVQNWPDENGRYTEFAQHPKDYWEQRKVT